MKQTLLIITALMLFVGCSSDPIDGSTLVRKDGLYYASDANEPYSGVAVEYYDNGQKMREGSYKDGERDRKWTGWYENGQKRYEETYKDGKEDGKWTGWWENGQKYLEGTYKNGKEDGLWTYWRENGQKWREVTYKDGQYISKKCWDDDGNESDNEGDCWDDKL